jgi:hypothetical protein
MNRATITTAVLGVLAAGSVTFAAAAAAAPSGDTSAVDTISQLRAYGYNVQVNYNSTRDEPLYTCTVTGTSGVPKSAPLDGAPTAQFTTVYVDVNCPPDN